MVVWAGIPYLFAGEEGWPLSGTGLGIDFLTRYGRTHTNASTMQGLNLSLQDSSGFEPVRLKSLPLFPPCDAASVGQYSHRQNVLRPSEQDFLPKRV